MQSLIWNAWKFCFANWTGIDIIRHVFKTSLQIIANHCGWLTDYTLGVWSFAARFRMSYQESNGIWVVSWNLHMQRLCSTSNTCTSILLESKRWRLCLFNRLDWLLNRSSGTFSLQARLFPAGFDFVVGFSLGVEAWCALNDGGVRHLLVIRHGNVWIFILLFHNFKRNEVVWNARRSDKGKLQP